MTTLAAATRAVEALPEVSRTQRYGHDSWAIGGRVFAWDRPFSKADLKRFGDDPVPAGPILALRLADLGEKAAVLAAHPAHCFTIPHFDGHPSVLVALPAVPVAVVRELVWDAWAAQAPAELVEAHRGR